MTSDRRPATFTPIAQTRSNNQITAPELRVIDDQGKNLGVLTKEQALALAKEKGLDLIEIAPTAKPPVVRIMSFDKYRYQEEKDYKKQRAQTKAQEIKQVQVSVRAAKNDLDRKAKEVEKFFKEGHLINVVMEMRGREKGNKDWAHEKLNEFLLMIPTEFEVLSQPRMGPRGLIMMIRKK